MECPFNYAEVHEHIRTNPEGTPIACPFLDRINKLRADLKQAQREVMLFDQSTSQEASEMWAVVLKERAEIKRLREDLRNSEDNAHELQLCYDEMLPLCKDMLIKKGK